MNDANRTYPLEEALRAQKALRDKAGLAPEMFPVDQFVGMISDEIDSMRQRGHSDETIAETIRASSAIQLTAEDIQQHYAPPSQRHPHEG